MLDLVMEKGASKDHDQSKSSIAWPRMGTPTSLCKYLNWIMTYENLHIQ